MSKSYTFYDPSETSKVPLLSCFLHSFCPSHRKLLFYVLLKSRASDSFIITTICNSHYSDFNIVRIFGNVHPKLSPLDFITRGLYKPETIDADLKSFFISKIMNS